MSGRWEAAAGRERFLLDRMEAGVVIHAASTEVAYANAKACALLGIPEPHIRGMPATHPEWRFVREDGSRMPVDEYPVCLALTRRAVVTSIVVGIQHGEGESITWAMCNGHPSLDAEGVVEEVVVTFTDITALKDAERTLAAAEERFRLMLQGSADAPWDLDLRTGQGYYSARWRVIAGETEEEARGADYWLDRVAPADAARVRAEFRLVLEGQARSFRLAYDMAGTDQETVPVVAIGLVLRDAAGTAIRVSGVTRDLSDLHRRAKVERRLAYHDPLTGLANRRQLVEWVEKPGWQIPGRCCAVMMFDLDAFSGTNEAFGYDTGDALLRQIGERLSGFFPQSDLVSRLDSDTFAIAMVRDPPAQELMQVARNAIQAATGTFIVSGLEQRVSGCVGIALAESDPCEADRLLRQADLALKAAKAEGPGSVRFFEPHMQAAVEERILLERELHRAVEAEALTVVYQPQVTASGALVGAEALLRWHHATRGPVPPATFIPVAERTGLILVVGRWVLRQACEQIARWSGRTVLGAVVVAVNVSVKQFQAGDFAADALRVLEQTGADPRLLKLEVTESLLADNLEPIVASIRRLRAAGVRISLDDFGTGYSSLRYLQQLPLDEIKIDRGFVSTMDVDGGHQVIADMIIAIAGRLGLGLVAEGVENARQRDLLVESGCAVFQGYFFGHPQAVENFERAFGS